jgi:hypothetical protein
MSFQGTTRTEPYERISRIRLPPRMIDVEALIRIGVQSPRWVQVTETNTSEPLPVELSLVATFPQLVSPDAAEPCSKQRKTG